MNTIAENLIQVRQSLPPKVTLVAVSKFHPVEALQEAYVGGQRIFGESRVQELAAKIPQLPSDVHWHFIGHLQTNKVKQLVALVPALTLIESIDSERLLAEVDKEASKTDKTIDLCLQIYIATEESKFGFSQEECCEVLAKIVAGSYPHIRIRGFMGMASNTDDKNQISTEFESLASLFRESKQQFFPQEESFNILSMGMSGDYPLGIEAGATSVRIGSAIFGQRIY